MKKQFYNLFIIIILFSFFLSNKLVKAAETAQLPPPPANMDEAFKNIDFEQMLKELEEIFGTDVEEKEKKPAPKKGEIVTEEKKAPTLVAKKETLQESFENPAKPEKEEKVVAKLPKEKLQAFDYYVDNFSKQLKKLDAKISGFKLGIAFKEKLEELEPSKASSKEFPDNYKNIISSIEKSLKVIEGRKPNPKRKMYKKVFFLPMFTNLREQIIKQTKELENINNRITDFEKISEEEKEKAEIEELQALAQKKSTTIKVPEKLKKDILNIFKKLRDTAEKLEGVTANSQAKSLIESKKKKREEDTKKAEERRKAEQRGYSPTYYPSRGGRPGTYWPSDKDEYWWGGPSSPAPSFAPTAKPGMETKPSEVKPEEKKEEKPSEGKKREKTEQEKNNETIENLSKSTIDLIGDILKPDRYKAGDEKSYEAILDSHSLSKISQNLDEISKLKSKVETEKEEKTSGLAKRTMPTAKVETSTGKKLEEALKKFTPTCIRLAKHYGGSEDQKAAAQNIIKELKTSNLQKSTNTEISKYEDEVLKKIDPKVLTEYDPQNKLDSVLKNLKVALTQPLGSQEKIDAKKDEVALAADKGLRKTKALGSQLEGLDQPDLQTRGIELGANPIEWQQKFEQENRTKTPEEILNRLKQQEKKLENIRALVAEGKGEEKASAQTRQIPISQTTVPRSMATQQEQEEEPLPEQQVQEKPLMGSLEEGKEYKEENSPETVAEPEF